MNLDMEKVISVIFTLIADQNKAKIDYTVEKITEEKTA